MPVYLIGTANTPDASDGALTAPPELAGPTPRNVRITGVGVTTAVVVAGLLGLVATLVVWFSMNAKKELEHRAALRQGSLVTSGEVTRIHFVGRSSTMMVNYTFPVDGTYYAGEASVPRKLEPTMSVHAFLDVRYLPADPAVNHPAAWEESTASSFAPFTVAAVFAITAFALLAGFPREKQLAAEGKLAVATVTACSSTRGGYQLTYEFRTEEGAQAKGGSVSDSRLQSGARIHILYMPQNPRRNQPYPMHYYRVDR
jgi:hypothetical protein